jgi:class 3 adenylate cyclase/predicted ATPase
MACGAALVTSSPEGSNQNQRICVEPSPAERQSLSVTEAERRQLTVLFCDLEASTALASQLDLEDLRDVVRAYQETAAAVIQHYQGYIAQYLGDGLLVYFGYPQAHEDDATRAVYAGLGILEAAGPLNRRMEADYGVRLGIRLGIHTGMVVVGEMGGGGRHERLALGETPNIASRLQAIAQPNTVILSEASYALIAGACVCHDLGLHTLRGLSHPLRVYRALSVEQGSSRLNRDASGKLTPLIGREDELQSLQKRWEQVKGGSKQIILLSGEAGIGKSRIVQDLKAYVINDRHVLLECRGSPYYSNSPFHVISEMIYNFIRVKQSDITEVKLNTLKSMLTRYSVDIDEALPLLASLLLVPSPDNNDSLPFLTSQQRRSKTLSVILNLLSAIVDKQPGILIVEDLQWVDPSTLELLNLLVNQGPPKGLYVLFTCRPIFTTCWASDPHVVQLVLHRLSDQQVEQMIAHMLKKKRLPIEVFQQLIIRADGIPLFVEELTKMIVEMELLQEKEDCYALVGPLPSRVIPSTLHDSLMARLDRFASAKAVAQQGATIGREFSYDLLRAISPLDEAMLQEALAQLTEAGLLYQQGLPPQSSYTFKHALIQDTAYQSLLRSTRKQYHLEVARALSKQFSEIAEVQPELLAHHYTEAGLAETAIDFWQRAGQIAKERSAHVEAISHLKKGLDLLSDLPSTSAHLQKELRLQTALGPALMACKGYAAPEVAHAYMRARELCEQIGDTPWLFPALRGLYTFYVAQADYRTARTLVERLLSVAHLTQEPSLLLEAHRALGTTLFYLGEFSAANHHLEQSLALYDPQHHATQALLYGQNAAVVCLSFSALGLWLRGYPNQGLTKSRQAVALAQEQDDPLSLVFALDLAAGLHQFRREAQDVQRQAEAMAALSTDHGFPFWQGMGGVKYGWALVEQGHSDAGYAAMRQGLDSIQATGTTMVRPSNLGRLAEAYGKIGQIEEGLLLLAEALSEVEQSGECYYQAELYRLKGEFLLLRLATDPHEAEAYFHQALDVARQQAAKSWELRAATSLARLWQQQGKCQEAHHLLAPVYNWFTEGFDTMDLQDAKRLLEKLES